MTKRTAGCLPQVQLCMNTKQRTCYQKWADNAQPLGGRKEEKDRVDLVLELLDSNLEGTLF